MVPSGPAVGTSRLRGTGPATVVALSFLTLATACGRGACEPGAASATIAELVPEGPPIRCERSRRFEIEGRSVYLELVVYGDPLDCAGGCSPSTVCAIRDDMEVELLHARWELGVDPDQTPVGIFDMCPDLLNPNGTIAAASTSNEMCSPPGLAHAVVSSASFQNYMRQQRANNGRFRFCVDQRIFGNAP